MFSYEDMDYFAQRIDAIYVCKHMKTLGFDISTYCIDNFGYGWNDGYEELISGAIIDLLKGIDSNIKLEECCYFEIDEKADKKEMKWYIPFFEEAKKRDIEFCDYLMFIQTEEARNIYSLAKDYKEREGFWELYMIGSDVLILSYDFSGIHLFNDILELFKSFKGD